MGSDDGSTAAFINCLLVECCTKPPYASPPKAVSFRLSTESPYILWGRLPASDVTLRSNNRRCQIRSRVSGPELFFEDGASATVEGRKAGAKPRPMPQRGRRYEATLLNQTPYDMESAAAGHRCVSRAMLSCPNNRPSCDAKRHDLRPMCPGPPRRAGSGQADRIAAAPQTPNAQVPADFFTESVTFSGRVRPNNPSG